MIKSIDNGTVARCVSFCAIIWYDFIMRRMMNCIEVVVCCIRFVQFDTAVTFRSGHCARADFHEYICNQRIRNARCDWRYLIGCVCLCVCGVVVHFLRGWKWIIMVFICRYLGWGQFGIWELFLVKLIIFPFNASGFGFKCSLEQFLSTNFLVRQLYGNFCNIDI